MNQVWVGVIGDTGMLGHTVAAELEKNPAFRVLRMNRRPGCSWPLDANDPGFTVPCTDFIINCAGVIWQGQRVARQEAFHVNGVFPWRLQDACHARGVRLIHVSTDCVFSGDRGGCTEADAPSSSDDYGLSKALGEPREAMVLRTSVIGRELGTHKSFLEWAISNRGKQINGFTNHVWNGVTSVEYARICADIMLKHLWSPGIHHLHSTTVTKFELLQKINATLDLNLDIVPFAHWTAIDRSLGTDKLLCSQLRIPSIDAMLADLKQRS